MNIPAESVSSKIPAHAYQPLPSGKTFWDEGQYEMVIKRLENGKGALNDFIFMVEERAAMERQYAEKLHNWYNKWILNVRRGSEYGEVLKVWVSILSEGRDMAEIHHSMSEQLRLTNVDGIQKKIYKFKKTYYHNLPLIKELKEVRELREAFKVIQAPYKNAVEKILKLKKKYFEASKNCIQLANKLKGKEPSATAKLGSLCDVKEKTKAKYVESLNFFNDNVREKYSMEMKAEFQKCQDFELGRLTILLNSLHDYIGIVNQQRHARQPLSGIYAQAGSPLTTVMPEKNLQLFAGAFGASMSQNFPKFEDTESESVKSRLQAANSSGISTTLFGFKTTALLLTRIKQLKSESQLKSKPLNSTKDFLLRRPSMSDGMSNSHESEFKDLHLGGASKHSLDSATPIDPVTQTSLTDLTVNRSKDHYTMNNVYVRAITNFVATLDEHLDISRGEVIYQMRGDENGWCYGRIGGKEGIYLSKAVRLLTMDLFSV